VTVIDLSVSLAGVLLVLPAAIALAERRAPVRTGASGAPRPGRRRTPAPVA